MKKDGKTNSNTHKKPYADILHIPDAKEWERKENVHLGEVLFAEEKIFVGASQRLIQQQSKDPNLPVIRSVTEEQKIIDLADTAIQVRDSTLVDTEHDLAILGLRLIARDEIKNIYYFQHDSEHDPYTRLEEIIPREKQDPEAGFCDQIGMHQLASEIREATVLTVADLLDLDRKYIKGWVPNEGARIFSINDRRGFVDEGLIENGVLKGVCDSFKYFVDEQMTGIFGEQNITEEGGYSLNKARIINSMLHGQTRLRIPARKIDAVLDVEPDPAKAVFEGSNSKGSMLSTSKIKTVEINGTEKINDETDYFAEQEIEDLLKLIPYENETGSSNEGNEQENKDTVNKPTESKNDLETKMLAKEKTELEPKSFPLHTFINQGTVITDIQTDKDVAQTVTADVISLPSPDADEEGLKVTFLQNNQIVVLKGADARKHIESKREEENKNLQLGENLKSTCFLYQRFLLTYLGETIDSSSFENIDKKIHKAFAPLLHVEPEIRIWESIPHVLIYSLVREYAKWEELNWGQRGKFTSINAERVAKAKELLKTYTSTQPNEVPRYKGRRLPLYDPRFLHLMDRVVNSFEAVHALGGTYR